MELYPIDIAIHLVNILVLYVLLRVLIWKPVRQFMAGREERVAAQMEQARALQAEAEKIKADYDARLVDVQATCDKMLSEGRMAAQTTGQKYIDKARAQADTILSEARAQADEEKRRAMDEVKEELADLAVDMASRVLRFDEQTRRNILLGTGTKTGNRKGVLKLAAPCDSKELSAIIDRLERLLGCHLELTTEIDSSLIGGFAALVDGKVYDFSYVTQLTAMQQKLA
mgnify:FL=1